MVSFIQHADELEHVGVVQAAHHLHLKEGRPRRVGGFFLTPSLQGVSLTNVTCISHLLSHVLWKKAPGGRGWSPRPHPWEPAFLGAASGELE